MSEAVCEAPFPAAEPNAMALVEAARPRSCLRDTPFDGVRFGASSGALRDQLIAQRMADLAPVGDDIAARLRAVGARTIVQFWLIPSP